MRRMPAKRSPPRWRRRKDARPGEIVAAALEVFTEKGFAGARLEEIAARAGVSKGALYLYFETKEQLFRAVVEQLATPDLEPARAMAAGFTGRFADLAPPILALLAKLAASGPLPAAAKMVIGESRNFPDLARDWCDKVASAALDLTAELIAGAQARGEIRPGDPRAYAMSLIGPMLAAIIWRGALVPIGAEPIDVQALAEQHARTVMSGMLAVRP
jgi:AcrR family transcriptional regulator